MDANEDQVTYRLHSLADLLCFAFHWQPTVWSVTAICISYHAWKWGVATWRYWQQEFTLGQQYATAFKATHAGNPSNTWQQQQQQNGDLIPVSYPASNAAARGGAQPAAPLCTAIVTGVQCRLCAVPLTSVAHLNCLHSSSTTIEGKTLDTPTAV
jgi:hypothetical protein